MDGAPALARLDTATRGGYLPGYYPSPPTRDNEFRAITVKVNRPHVTLLYRRGYRARAVPPAFDRVDYATRSRIEAAATYEQDVKDISVSLAASLERRNGRAVAHVKARIEPVALHFGLRDGIHVGQVY